ncbi:MAG: MaoC family dehydratase [Oscillibacter sp.]|nr:MaoC family dehydratase [Oscillibacter sp.]
MDYSAKIKHWDDIAVGNVETFTKTMTQTDMVLWVGLTGDLNPVHIDKEYAATTRFQDVIIPGLMVAGLIFTVMTQSTFGNVYSGQTLKFLKPVYVGDTVTAVATVIEKMEEKHRVKIKTECYNQRDELVIVGEGQEYIM